VARPMARVVLPRSLVALFPGSERQEEVTASTVAEAVDALDRRWPGMRDRICEPGPAIRPHINVFVDGQPATLDTPVGPGATVHVIPAVAGG
jgi:molybdopterin synthase sulfur carrier subunit